jgi:hypothetical protein
MIKNLKLKVLLFAFLFICGTVIIAQANFKNPPTPPEHYAGPAMPATIVTTYDDNGTPGDYSDDCVNVKIEAQRKGIKITAEQDYCQVDNPSISLKDVFDAADKDNLNDTTLDFALSQQLGGGMININTVRKFNRDENVITADVILLYVVSGK